MAAAIDDGFIHLDEAACNYFPHWKTNDLKSKITIRQLATHTSGLVDAEVTEAELEKLKSKGLKPHFDLPGRNGQFWRNLIHFLAAFFKLVFLIAVYYYFVFRPGYICQVNCSKQPFISFLCEFLIKFFIYGFPFSRRHFLRLIFF